MTNFVLSPETNDKLQSLLKDFYHYPKTGIGGGGNGMGRSFQQSLHVQIGSLVDATPMYNGTTAMFDGASRSWVNQTGAVYVIDENFGILITGNYYSGIMYGNYEGVPVVIVGEASVPTTCIPIVTAVSCDGSTLSVTQKYLHLPSFTLNDTPC
jgi:hypothetical protein